MNKLLIPILLSLLFSTSTTSWAVKMPIAPGMDTSSVTNQTEVNGMKMRIVRFETKQSPEQVIAYYDNYWSGEAVQSPLPPWQMIGMRKSDHFINVQVQQQLSGSWGYISISNLPGKLDKDEPEISKPTLSGFPAMSGSQAISNQKHDDGFKTAQTILLMNTYTPSANRSYYLEQLAQRGWELTADSDKSRMKSKVLMFSRGRETLTLTIKKGSSGRTQIVANTEKAGFLHD